MKCRIVKHNGKFRVQYRFLLFWIFFMTLGDDYVEFKTEAEARKAIEKYESSY